MKRKGATACPSICTTWKNPIPSARTPLARSNITKTISTRLSSTNPRKLPRRPSHREAVRQLESHTTAMPSERPTNTQSAHGTMINLGKQDKPQYKKQKSGQTSPRIVASPPRARVVCTITRTRRPPAGRIPSNPCATSTPTPCTSVVRVRVSPPTPLTAVIAYTTAPVTTATPVVSGTTFSTASCRLLFALLAALDDVFDADTTPWETGRGIAVLQVARVGVRVGVTGGGLILRVADGFLVGDFRLLACVEEGRTLVQC